MKAKCPECKKPYAPKYLNKHRQDVHGVEWVRVGRGRRAAAASLPAPITATLTPGLPTFVRMAACVMAEDSQGGTWLCERIR